MQERQLRLRSSQQQQVGITVIVNVSERGTARRSGGGLRDACRDRHVGKGAIPVIVVPQVIVAIFAGDENVVEAILIVIAYGDAGITQVEIGYAAAAARGEYWGIPGDIQHTSVVGADVCELRNEESNRQAGAGEIVRISGEHVPARIEDIHGDGVSARLVSARILGS